jgi:hypothetical protein
MEDVEPRPEPPHGVEAGGTEEVSVAGHWKSRFKAVGCLRGKRNLQASSPRAEYEAARPKYALKRS